MSKRSRNEPHEDYETVCIPNVIKDELVTLSPTVPDEEEDTVEDTIEIVQHDPISPTEFYDRFVKKTAEQLKQEQEAEQRSKEWLQAREVCLTASNFGTAAGRNPYSTPENLVREKLWNTFTGNAATEYGSLHEDDARISFETWFKQFEPESTLISKNLLRSIDCPWLGVSPDNILVHEDGTLDLVEYKCPAFRKYTIEHPYNKYKYNVPEYYYDQMQGIMGYLNNDLKILGSKLTCAWFVVWQPKQTFITKIPFDQNYWTTSLYPKLHDWYFGLYLPALTHKYNGELDHGEIKANEPIEV